MNFYPLYIQHYFQSPLAIYEATCWFLLNKIWLILSSRSFPPIFSPDLCEKFFLSCKAFHREWKRGKSLSSMPDEYSGWGRIEKPKSNIFLAWFLLNVALHYHQESQHFFDWWVWDIFLKRFSCTHCECKSALSVSLHFKNSKRIILQWSHKTYRITFLPWSSAFGVGCRDRALSLHCLLHWILL